MKITVSEAIGLGTNLEEIKEFPTLKSSFEFAKLRNELDIVKNSFTKKQNELIVELGKPVEQQPGTYTLEGASEEVMKDFQERINKYIAEPVELSWTKEKLQEQIDAIVNADFTPKTSQASYHKLFGAVDRLLKQ